MTPPERPQPLTAALTALVQRSSAEMTMSDVVSAYDKLRIALLAREATPAKEPADLRCWEHRPGRGHARRCIRETGHEGQHIDFEAQYWTTGDAAPPAPSDGLSIDEEWRLWRQSGATWEVSAMANFIERLWHAFEAATGAAAETTADYFQRYLEASMRADRAEAQLAALKAEPAAPRFDPTNHHNALTCPHCNPDGLVLMKAEPAAAPTHDIRLMPDVAIVNVLKARAAHDANDTVGHWIGRLLSVWVTDAPLAELDAIVAERFKPAATPRPATSPATEVKK